MATYLLFDGALNTQLLGIQAYLWIMLAMGILAVGTYVVWYFFFWAPLKPVHGHFTSHMYHTNSATTFDENNTFALRSEKKAKLIFDTTVNEARELQKDWDVAPSGLIGRVLNDLIFDGGRWLDMKSPVRGEIEYVASAWNDANPNDMIMTLGKFWRYLEADKFRDIMLGRPAINKYYLVPWKRIDMAIPRDHIQPMWDGYLRQLARQKDNDQNSDYGMYGYIILAIGALICLGMLAIKFIG